MDKEMSVHANTKLITLITVLATAPMAANAALVGATNLGSISSLGTTGSYTWSQLGPDYTVLTGSHNVASSGSGPAAVVNSAGNALEILQQGAGWGGTFSPTGVPVLWDKAVGPDISMTFQSAVSGAGAQIESDYLGIDTAVIQAWDTSGNFLGSFSETANTSTSGAIFIGVSSNVADIGKISFTLSSAPGNINDFAIATVYEATQIVSPVPLPASAWLMLSGCGGLGAFARRKRAA